MRFIRVCCFFYAQLSKNQVYVSVRWNHVWLWALQLGSDPLQKGGGISPSDLEEGKRYLPTVEEKSGGGKNSCFSAKEEGDDGRGSISHLYRGKGEIKRGKTWTNVTFSPFFFPRGKFRKALCVCANAVNLFGEVSIPTNEKRNTEREDRPSSSWHLRCPNEPLLLLFLFLLLLVLLTTKEAITQSGGGGGGMPLFLLLLLLISRTLREKEHKLEAPPPLLLLSLFPLAQREERGGEFILSEVATT